MKNNLAFQVRRRIFDHSCASAAPARIPAWRTSGCPAIATIPCTTSSRASTHTEPVTASGGRPRRRAGSRRGFRDCFLEADLRAIPVTDGYFDYGICNAVIEHGGRAISRGSGRGGLSRVAVRDLHHPEQALPLELHTLLPLLHWLPDAKYRACLRRLGLRLLRGDREPEPAGRGDLPVTLPFRPPESPARSGLPLLRSNLVCLSAGGVRPSGPVRADELRPVRPPFPSRRAAGPEGPHERAVPIRGRGN